MSLRPLIIVLASALALGACGKRGTLERPPPLIGDKSEAAATKGDPERKGTDGTVRDPAPESRPTSPRVAPIDGAPRSAFDGPGQMTDPH